MMESLGVWFLGVIALAMVVQVGFMIALALGAVFSWSLIRPVRTGDARLRFA